jgi:hypothetical protein
MKEVAIAKTQMIALVDDGDYSLVKDTRWILSKGFVMANNPTRLLHRFILGIIGSKANVNFRNGNQLDCQRSNLEVYEKWYPEFSYRSTVKDSARHIEVVLRKEDPPEPTRALFEEWEKLSYTALRREQIKKADEEDLKQQCLIRCYEFYKRYSYVDDYNYCLLRSLFNICHIHNQNTAKGWEMTNLDLDRFEAKTDYSGYIEDPLEE